MILDDELALIESVPPAESAEETEAVATGTMGAVLKGEKKSKKDAPKDRESRRMAESGQMLEAVDAVPGIAGDKTVPYLEGPKVKAVLLTEGMGNLRDKNYYGQEAVLSMPAVFEGAPCMIDHPSYTEERDIPEGRVNRTVGYFKNLRTESINGTLGCVGELHFDLSQEGWNAYQKAKTAIHYAKEFPGSDREYIGLSVNAAGESETRTMVYEGEEMEVNYVTRFIEARSCDLVTIPARGGKIVALVESESGARKKNEEVRMETVKRLEAATAALKEAESQKNPDLRQKKVTEARKEVEALLKDITEAQARKESEPVKETEESKAKEDMDEAKCADDDGDMDDMPKKKEKKSKAESAVEAERKEAHTLAIKALVAESGLNPKYFDLDEMEAMTLKESKREIARVKRVHEASAEDILKKLGDDVSAAHIVRESGTGSSDGQASNNALFADLSH